ncbi:MAG: hypothetical protein Q7T74_06415 [Candidatus Saccharibacteria bacterium]|nr:hypothetical protein [Candidatus Saccharibacteria bacterium]
MDNKEFDIATEKKLETKKKFLNRFRMWFVTWWPMVVAMVIIMLAAALYFKNFNEPLYKECVGRWDEDRCISERLADDRSAWGQFGDFIGGTVNPIIGFLTVILLLITIRQQSAAINHTESALEQAGKSLEHAEKALLQNEAALKITRDEISIAREEINLSRAINAKTEEALSAQIDISRRQNYLSNYFEHRNQYVDYVVSIFKDEQISKYKIFPRSFHIFGYPNAKDGDLSLRVDILERFHSELIQVAEYLSCLKDNLGCTREEFSNFLRALAINRYKFYRGYIELNHTVINVQSGLVFSNGLNIDVPHLTVKRGFQEFIDSSRVIQMMIAFDGDFINGRIRTALDLLQRLQHAYPALSLEEHGNLNSDFDRFIKQKEMIFSSLQRDLDDITSALNGRD